MAIAVLTCTLTSRSQGVFIISHKMELHGCGPREQHRLRGRNQRVEIKIKLWGGGWEWGGGWRQYSTIDKVRNLKLIPVFVLFLIFVCALSILLAFYCVLDALAFNMT